MRAPTLIEDPGILGEGSVYEFQGCAAVRARGGTAVLPWRDSWLEANAAGVHCVSSSLELPLAPLSQCVVHAQRSRAATWADLAAAWTRLSEGGALFLSGHNEVGITALARRLGRELGQEPRVLSNRSHGRVVRFERDAGSGPTPEATPDVALPDGRTLESAPGVFSARRLDAGSAVLLDALAARSAPGRLLDLGCGAGALAIGALGRWTGVRALCVDADMRAVRCARRNIERCGLVDICRAEWWDAHEPALESGFDLALVNPPFHHRGPAVDFGPARAMFASLPRWLAPGGEALLVANRSLPYESVLRESGELQVLSQEGGYKLLSWKRPPEPAAAQRRRSPR